MASKYIFLEGYIFNKKESYKTIYFEDYKTFESIAERIIVCFKKDNSRSIRFGYDQSCVFFSPDTVIYSSINKSKLLNEGELYRRSWGTRKIGIGNYLWILTNNDGKVHKEDDYKIEIKLFNSDNEAILYAMLKQ